MMSNTLNGELHRALTGVCLAHHIFDHPGIDTEEIGLIIRSDPEAAAQAIRMTREFLIERF